MKHKYHYFRTKISNKILTDNVSQSTSHRDRGADSTENRREDSVFSPSDHRRVPGIAGTRPDQPGACCPFDQPSGHRKSTGDDARRS